MQTTKAWRKSRGRGLRSVAEVISWIEIITNKLL
jgi:hypothetical protein